MDPGNFEREAGTKHVDLADQPEGCGFYSRSSVTPLRGAQKGSDVVEFTCDGVTSWLSFRTSSLSGAEQEKRP